jgi:hypothetical protein
LILLRKELVKDRDVLGIQAQSLAGMTAEETNDLHTSAKPAQAKSRLGPVGTTGNKPFC